MGLRSQNQVRMKQAAKRKARRKRLSAKGANLNEYFYGKYYVKLGA
jgi:hypothetical protein